ncbi:hypothetical protein RJ640_010124 [Escallonia rubra]|uniref:Reverse transcriptase domain-containing protein n=1 Tax=Escallonia rubra TaxID=112253 RepID=A0AA88UMC7_9ASTE|nr:hypothetical protein RJ640_010124 [Escallonia rubra]
MTDKNKRTIELMRNYHREDFRVPRCAMKVDLMKANDCLHWDFLFDVLICLRFPPMVIRWIKACVSNTSFSIIINGESNGFFLGRRGIRQGDLMSPYLFVICMDVLVGMLQTLVVGSQFRYHWRCQKDGDIPLIQVLKHGLSIFQQFSGLVPNPNKSHYIEKQGNEGNLLNTKRNGRTISTARLKNPMTRSAQGRTCKEDAWAINLAICLPRLNDKLLYSRLKEPPCTIFFSSYFSPFSSSTPRGYLDKDIKNLKDELHEIMDNEVT